MQTKKKIKKIIKNEKKKEEKVKDFSSEVIYGVGKKKEK